MPEAVIMPKAGMAMREGVIITWLCREGEQVKKGDPVAEIETDKTTMELESDSSGTVLKLLFPAGSVIPVTAPIAWIGQTGDKLPETPDLEEYRQAAGPILSFPVMEFPKEASKRHRVRSTPAAKRAAREQGIDLSGLTPSGRQGEIRLRDVDRAAGRQLGERQQVMHEGDTRVRLTGIQRITGQRMLASIREIPMVTIDTRADVTELLEMRRRMNSGRTSRLSINDFVLRAVARALRDHPRMNSVLDGDALIYRAAVNLGFAAATPGGLVVPVLRNADSRSLDELSAAVRELVEQARSHRLRPEHLQDASFTVTNLGRYGVSSFTPIINPPEAGILGVCAVEQVPRFVDGELTARELMSLSLTFDHRIIDGAGAAGFLQAVRRYLEQPYQ